MEDSQIPEVISCNQDTYLSYLGCTLYIYVMKENGFF